MYYYKVWLLQPIDPLFFSDRIQMLIVLISITRERKKTHWIKKKKLTNSIESMRDSNHIISGHFPTSGLMRAGSSPLAAEYWSMPWRVNRCISSRRAVSTLDRDVWPHARRMLMSLRHDQKSSDSKTRSPSKPAITLLDLSRSALLVSICPSIAAISLLISSTIRSDAATYEPQLINYHKCV